MSMTVEEAIERLKQEARNKRADADWKWRHGRLNSDDLIESAESMEQLAKWLEEIQQYRAIGTVERFKYLSQSEHNYENCHNLTCRTRCEKDGYVKAIDEYADRLASETEWYHPGGYALPAVKIRAIAKELKGERRNGKKLR